MTRLKKWNETETKKLIENYYNKTIQELMVLFPKRSQESINNKIKRLKIDGKISGGKEENTIQRSYDQRGQELALTPNQEI